MNKNKLGIFNSNIIKWYPFKNDKSIIQIGVNEYITKELEKRLKDVKVIGSIENLSFDIKYDYILIYGYENYSNVIEKLARLLNESGKILIIGNNKTGIDNWSKYCLNDNNGVQMLENHNMKTRNAMYIKENLKKYDFNTNEFYVFPNYQESEVVINEKFKIEKAHLEKYNPDIQENEIKVFDEIKVLKTIVSINSELLDFFANSYFIEASKEEIKTDVKYVSFNNCRKEKYRLMTIIKEDVVEKVAVNEKSEEHIENMIKIIHNIKENGIDILDYEQNGRIYSKLIKDEKTLDRILFDKRDNLDEVVEILESIKQILLKNSVNIYDVSINEEIRNKIKDDYNLEEDNLKELHFLKNAYWDMIPKNCFYMNNKFMFFDQEWEKQYLSVEFIIYRSVINSYDLVREVNVDNLLEKLGILQYKEDFQKIDENIRKEIIDNDMYNLMYGKEIKSVNNLINDNKLAQMQIQQLEEDNQNKQKYINALEEKNKINEQQLNKIKKIFFWKK